MILRDLSHTLTRARARARVRPHALSLPCSQDTRALSRTRAHKHTFTEMILSEYSVAQSSSLAASQFIAFTLAGHPLAMTPSSCAA